MTATKMPDPSTAALLEEDGAGAAPAGRPRSLHAVPPPSTRERADRFYRDYGPAIYRRCLRLLHDREAARDAAQEVFVKVLRQMARLEDPGTALPWAYRVATNHCLNLLRDDRRRREEPVDTHMELEAEAETAYPEAQLARAVLSRFDALTQAVATGVYVHEMEHEEVAGMLGISRRTVSRKLDRFIENARKFLARSE